MRTPKSTHTLSKRWTETPALVKCLSAHSTMLHSRL